MAKKPSLRPAVTPTRRGATAIRRPLPIATPNRIGETNAETKQKFSVKTEPKITTKIVKLSQRFSIYGNKDAEVKRVYGRNGGDGNLSTDHTRYVEVSGKPSFSYDGKKGTASFKVDFRYYAYEQDAGRKAGRDGLEFTKSITISEKVGVANVNLSKMKNGHISAIRFSTLEAICDVLDCQPGDILIYEETEDEDE